MIIGNSMGKNTGSLFKSVNGELLELRSPSMDKNVDKLLQDVGTSGKLFPRILEALQPCENCVFPKYITYKRPARVLTFKILAPENEAKESWRKNVSILTF